MSFIQKSWKRLFLWIGVIAPILRHVAIYGIGLASPGYSARRDFISELGAIGAPYDIIMNVFGISLIGLMMICFSITLFHHVASISGGPSSAALIGVSGVAFILIGLFPCDPGCISTEPSLRMTTHLLAGLMAMGFEIAAPLIFGILVFRSQSQRPLRWIGFVLGLIGATGYIVLIAQANSLQNPGLIQRVVQAAGDGWILIIALYFLRRT